MGKLRLCVILLAVIVWKFTSVDPYCSKLVNKIHEFLKNYLTLEKRGEKGTSRYNNITSTRFRTSSQKPII